MELVGSRVQRERACKRANGRVGSPVDTMRFLDGRRAVAAAECQLYVHINKKIHSTSSKTALYQPFLRSPINVSNLTLYREKL